jgi:hypothetical protein
MAAYKPVPMTPMGEDGTLADPLTVAIAHAFEVYDLDDIEAQDGDMLRGLARLAAYTVRQQFRVGTRRRTLPDEFRPEFEDD